MDLISANYSFSEFKNLIDNIIKKFIEKESNLKIKEILNHSLLGGKRIRPIITLLIFKSFFNKSVDYEKLSNLLLIPELVHNVSLIIDDLPCMDNDNYRRNKETTHFKFGIIPSYITISKMVHNIFLQFKDNTDYHMKFYFKTDKGRVKYSKVNEFIDEKIFETIEDLIDGQYYDLKFLDTDFDLDVIYKINSKKTAPLFVLSFILGYIGILLFNKNFIVEEEVVYKLRDIGELFGFIFQLNDDIVDRKQDLEDGKNLNISIHLGEKKSIEVFCEKCEEFKEKLENLSLWNDNFKEIIQLLKKRINI